MIGQMVAVPGRDAEATIAEDDAQLDALMSGRAALTIPLNGGSETRSAAREYWREWAAARGLGFTALAGCIVRIGA